MKQMKLASAMVLSLCLLSSGTVLADRGYGGRHGGGHGGGHIGLGFYFGAPYLPYYSPWYYPYSYPYYPYPPVVMAPPAPSVYIEQGNQQEPSQQAAPQQENYWYYCGNPEGYYPYVKECPGGWRKVSPIPQNP